VDSRRVTESVYELLVHGVPATKVVKPQIRPNLSLIPAKVELYEAEMELVDIERREHRIRSALESIREDFDFVLIDCPSWPGLLTINALTAADGVILPLRCEYFALEGMQHLLSLIRQVRERKLNPGIQLFGIVMTMFDPRWPLGGEVVREIREHFPEEKFDTITPRHVRLMEAASYGQTILEMEARSPGALAYRQLAEEVIARAAAVPAIEARQG
jgi:chromosome partitioning protein